jgi:hypothetical protein
VEGKAFIEVGLLGYGLLVGLLLAALGLRLSIFLLILSVRIVVKNILAAIFTSSPKLDSNFEAYISQNGKFGVCLLKAKEILLFLGKF